MPGQKHIMYTAADLERYHNGKMNAKERHALEKAALDDPFLSDALEGYSVTSGNAVSDIDLLNKRLDERISTKKRQSTTRCARDTETQRNAGER